MPQNCYSQGQGHYLIQIHSSSPSSFLDIKILKKYSSELQLLNENRKAKNRNLFCLNSCSNLSLNFLIHFMVQLLLPKKHKAGTHSTAQCTDKFKNPKFLLLNSDHFIASSVCLLPRLAPHFLLVTPCHTHKGVVTEDFILGANFTRLDSFKIFSCPTFIRRFQFFFQ